MPTVAAMNITAVKSTALHRPDAIDLRSEGASGDRRFLFARLDGTRPSGISKAPLMPLRARWDAGDERLTIATPDGAVVEGDARPTGEPVEVALYDRTVAARTIDPVFDALVEAIDPTLALMRVDEPEYAGGVHRVSLISSASVADVGSRGGETGLDPRRFRMLLEVDGIDPYEEDTWQGRRIAVGEAVVRLGARIPRCVMTTLDPDSGSKDFDTLDVLAGHRRDGNDLLLGVYGDVEEPGAVAVGDDVTVVA
jgi:hypothetical protein